MRTIAHRLAALGAIAVVVATAALAATPAVAAGAAPVATDNWFFATPGTSELTPGSAVRGSVSDAEGDPVTIVWETVALPGMTLDLDGTIAWEVPSDFCGALTLQYRASDGTSLSNLAIIEMWAYDEVEDQPLDCAPAPAPSTPPVGGADEYTMGQGATLSVDSAAGLLANDSDGDGEPLQIESWNLPTLPGAAWGFAPDGSFMFSPPAGFVGDFAFTYDLSDGTSLTQGVAAVIHVTAPEPVLDTLTAVDDEFTVLPGQTLTVDAASGLLSNDVHSAGSGFEVIAYTDPASGAFSLLADGSFQWTAPETFCEDLTFTYVAGGSTASSNTATVTLRPEPGDYKTNPCDDSNEEPGDGTVGQPGSPTVPTLPLPTDPTTPEEEPGQPELTATPNRGTLADTGASELAEGIGWSAFVAILLGLGLIAPRLRRGSAA